MNICGLWSIYLADSACCSHVIVSKSKIIMVRASLGQIPLLLKSYHGNVHQVMIRMNFNVASQHKYKQKYFFFEHLTFSSYYLARITHYTFSWPVQLNNRARARTVH